ncbi:hypothetical protein LEP1GSC161_0041 [Leptospira santarosai str. CBC1416]|uniref:Uncharacterized protein n=1 Tax=Leptospira santarosai str. CBC1416 TaxID=1193059 RepID=M6VHZ4_9LEPT|nr:hypothetical protein LEP1GSC161_0041 [Leptospira santarosai str. CBC1416]
MNLPVSFSHFSIEVKNEISSWSVLGKSILTTLLVCEQQRNNEKKIPFVK